MYEVQPQTPARRGKRAAWTIGLIAAGALAGGVVATALPALADPTPSPSTSSGTAPGGSGNGAPGNGVPGYGGRGGGAGQRSDETLLTGTDKDKATAAALKAVPGGTVDRVETDADGAVYEAHMTKSDGTKVTVKFDKDFNVTGIEAGMGAHR
jgi:hypothetical protein